MKNLSLLILFSLSILITSAQQKILFDNTKNEQAGNADWVIDVNSQTPSPAQSGISGNPLPNPTGDTDTYWSGALSMFGIEMVKQGYFVETLPSSGNITYGDGGNPQDLSNYDVFVVCEPNNPFTSAEKTAMMNFVYNGGGLFMIADHAGADRDSDGWDALEVWNDFITNNSVQNNAFGFTFEAGSNYTDAHSTNIANLPGSDPILHGIAGDVGGLEFHGGASIEINTTNNASVKAAVYKTGASNTGTTEIMCAYATYGNGRVVGLGDSSAAEDDTPNGGTTYTGWIQPIGGSEDKDNGTLVTNATIWLAGTLTTSIQKGPYMIFPNDNTKMTILWQLDGTETCTLSYGTSLSYGTDITTSEYGTSHQHKQKITGLTPNTKYYYKIVFAGTTLTGSFLTAPATNEKEIKFFAYGDTRTYFEDTNNVTQQMLSEISGDAGYQTFSLHTGDWVDHSENESEWGSQFFSRTGSCANNLEFHSKVPLMGVRGNHENYDASYNKSNATVYYKYFPYSFDSGSTDGDDMYYSFDYGPVHIAVVDQYDNGTYNTPAISSAQKTWLSNDLSSSTKPWKFVLLHEPAWSAKSTSKAEHSNNADAQTNIHPLCTANDVKMVFGGHNHYYAHALKDGVHHMTLGGGGAPLYNPTNTSGGVIVHAEKTFHFAKVNISEVDPKVIIVRPNGTIVETISLINKPTTFTATGISATQIDLSWAQNDDADDILLVFNTTNTFGTPTGTYTAGNTIAGGGTVLEVANSTYFSHTGLSNQTYYYQIWSIHNGYYSLHETVNATPLTIKAEPTNHPTAFSATDISNSQIDLSWTDATGAVLPDYYLIKANTTGTFTNPSDGTDPSEDTDLSDGSAVVKIAHGSKGATSFTGLTASTQYYFKIWPFTNTGTDINFKTDGTVLTSNATTQATSSSCASESFDNCSVGSSYSDGSFTGDNGFVWNYYASRDENGDENGSGIDGNALMLRQSSSSSRIVSASVPNGIGDFSVKLYKGFTGSGNRQVELFVNGTSQGTSTGFDDYNEHIFTVSGINITGNVTIELKNITSKQIIVDNIEWTCYSGAATSTITVSTATLTGFTYLEGNGPSAEQSFTVEGSNLTNNITITPPTNWEISTGTGGSFVATNPITLTQSGGTVNSTTIYTRMVSGLLNANSPFSGNIACESNGATTQNVAVDGTVTLPLPNIVINEIAANPGGAYNNEFVELYNNGSSSVDLNDYKLIIKRSGSSDVTVTIGTTGTGIGGTSIAAGGYFVVTRGTVSSSPRIEWGNFYMNESLHVILENSSGTQVDIAGSNYDFNKGRNYELCSPSTDNSIFANWTDQGTSFAGTAGALNSASCGPTIDISGTDPTSDDFVQSSNDNIFYKIEVAVAGGTDQQVSKINFDAVSTGANLNAIVSGYTLRYSTDATLDAGDSNLGTINSTAVTTQSNIEFDFSATPVTINSGNTGYFFITTNVLSNATVGATIQATNAGATYTTNGGATDTETYTVGNAHTIALLKNAESDIVTNANEANTVSSIMNDATINTTADGTEVWQFTIRDGGSDNTDADNLATIVNAITITQASGNAMNDWADAIQACALFNGSTLISNSPTITSNQIQFSGSPLISVPDEGSVTLSLRISIQTSPNDSGNNNDGDDFVFQISQGNVTADAAGSGFDTFSATTSTNGKNVFDVTATELHFVQQPSDIGVDNVMVPHPSVEATDANGNRDLDYTANISLTSTGSMTGSPISVAAVAGISEFSNVVHTVVQTNRELSATSGSLTATGNSDPFDVLNITTFDYGDLAILAVNTNTGSGGKDQIAFVSFIDIFAGTKFYLTDNGYEREFADQWGGSEGVISLTRTGSTLAAGTIIVIEATNGNITLPSHFDIWVNGAIDNNWTKTALTGTGIGGFNLNSDDDVWIMQGGTWTNSTTHHSTYDGTVLYGWTESGWQTAPGGASQSTKWSTLYPNANCFTTVAPTGDGKVKFDDPDPNGDFASTTNSQLDWIALINTTGNWDTYGDNAAYNSGGFDYKGDTNAPQLTIAANNHTEGVWNGSVSTDWFDCSNWETLSVPDQTTNVTIDASQSNNIVVDDASSLASLYDNISECRDLTLNNLIDLQVNPGDRIDVYGNLDISSASFTMTANSILNLYGNFTNNEATTEFVESTGNVNLLGTTTQTITSSHTEEFYNLVVNNNSPSGVVLGGSIDINGELTHTNGTIDLNGNNLNCSGVYARTNGEFKGNSASDLTFDVAGAIADLHFSAPLELHDLILGRTETVNLQSNIDVYNELQIISGAEIANNGNNINVREVVDINGTHSGIGKIILSNTASGIYAVQGTGSIGNIEMNGAGDDALLGNAVNVNNFTLTAGNSFDTDNYNMNVTGNWTNNVLDATFVEGTGTVTFNGTSTQTITAPNGQEFNNLVIDNPTTTNASLITVQNNLTINASDVFTINPGKNITVLGTFTNTPGTSGLILKSDATGTASLIHNTANIPATCERYLDANQWHFLSIPLSAASTSQLNVVSWDDTNPNFYYYDETIADFWQGTALYAPTGWTSESNAILDPLKGYIHRSTEARTYVLTGGNLEDSDVDITLSYTNSGTGNEPTTGIDWDEFEGWNMFVNPYACAIDWDIVWASLNATEKTYLENGIYYLDNADLSEKGGYKFYQNGNSTPNHDTGITLNGGTKDIPANQTVFIKATPSGNGQTITIPKSARLHSSQDFWKKSQNTLADNTIRLSIANDNYEDETIIRTLDIATYDHDYSIDAYKMFAWDTENPQILSRNNENSKYFGVNSIPNITSHTVIPLVTYIGTAGEYSIKNIENAFVNTHVWLEDRAENIFTKFNSANDVYTFSQTAETNYDRFYLHFDLNHKPLVNIEIPDQISDVNEYFSYSISENTFIDNDFEDVLTLSASLADGTALPEWLTFNATTNEFSGTPDEVQVLNIKLTAKDSFNETIYDEFKLTVKSVSSIAKLSENSISIYPNPANDKITIELSKAVNSKISIIDIAGQVVYSAYAHSQKSEIDLSNLAKGIYFVDIIIKGQTVRKKIVLQ